jgi:hypothetical protein
MKLKWIISMLTLIFLIYCIFCFPRKNSYTKSKKNRSVLCVDSGFSLTIPPALGLLMDPNIPPTSWKTYNGFGESNSRIFFHETSGKNKLTITQCCSIESAAKHHPNRSIQLFVRPPESFFDSSMALLQSNFLNTVWMRVLSRYPNVSVILLNYKNYFFGTPMEDWYKKKEWLKSQFEIAHMSDYVRILSLYKSGGLYLDLDVLTLKPYDGTIFRNFLVYGSARMDHISNGAMHIEFGHWISKEIMELLVKEYDPDSYIYHGPEAVSEVMKNFCGLAAGNSNSNQCNDIHLLADSYFYPIPSIFSNVLFQEGGNTTHAESLDNIKKSFGLHWWNSLSHFHQPLNIYSDQIINILAHEHCPITVSMAKNFPF